MKDNQNKAYWWCSRVCNVTNDAKRTRLQSYNLMQFVCVLELHVL